MSPSLLPHTVVLRKVSGHTRERAATYDTYTLGNVRFVLTRAQGEAQAGVTNKDAAKLYVDAVHSWGLFVAAEGVEDDTQKALIIPAAGDIVFFAGGEWQVVSVTPRHRQSEAVDHWEVVLQ